MTRSDETQLRLLAVVAAGSLLTGCSLVTSETSGTASCDPDASMQQPAANADYPHFIRWDGRLYVDPHDDGAVAFGEQLGTVRCRLDGSRTPEDYEARDGDAAFLDAGTPVYAVKGVPTSAGIGARWEGRRWLFPVDVGR